jgi:hypothetical protein
MDPQKKSIEVWITFNLFTIVPWVGLTQIILFLEFLIKIRKKNLQRKFGTF